MERAVKRGVARRGKVSPKVLGVDEKAIATRHRYGTLLNDLDQGCVLEVVKDRRIESLRACYDSLGKEGLKSVKAVAMDMWQPFIRATHDALPDADDKIVFDRFHISKYLTNAVDLIRRSENRSLVAVGNERLVGSKHLWLWNEENVPERRQLEFARLKKSRLKTARGWAIKEAFRDFWDLYNEEEGKTFFKHWFYWASRSRLAPMVKAARVIEKHLPNVLTYFKHRITNAASEGINAGIALLNSRARGYRNFANFRLAILFRHGGLELYPGQLAIS
jgi:transposase